jgi:hypothetical protein
VEENGTQKWFTFNDSDVTENNEMNRSAERSKQFESRTAYALFFTVFK